MLTDAEALCLIKLQSAGFTPGTVVTEMAFWGQRRKAAHLAALRAMARAGRFRPMRGNPEAYRVMPGAFEGLSEWKETQAREIRA